MLPTVTLATQAESYTAHISRISMPSSTPPSIARRKPGRISASPVSPTSPFDSSNARASAVSACKRATSSGCRAGCIDMTDSCAMTIRA